MSDLHFDVSTNKPTITYDINLLKTGKQEYSKTIDLDMAKGNQIVVPEEGKVLSKVVINKPETLISENVRENVNIGGIIGNLKPYVPIISSELNIEPSIESQVFTPSENEYYSKVNVNAVTSSIDSNITPENIAKNVEILGVVGTLVPQGKDMYQEIVDVAKQPVGLQSLRVTNFDFLNNLDTSNCNNFTSAFYNCSLLEYVPETWNTSKVINFFQAIRACPKITSIPNWDFSSGTDFRYCFYGCKGLSGIVSLNINNASDIGNCFASCSNIEEININVDEGKLTYCEATFSNCSKLKKIFISDVSNIKTTVNLFAGCSSLTTIDVDFSVTSKLTNSAQMFQSCIYIENIPEIKTTNVTNISAMCSYCTRLVTIQLLDLYSCTNTSNMLYNCTNLVNLTLKNIKVNLTIGSGTSYGTLLSQESLINTIKELWSYKDTSTTRTLTMATASKTLISSIYVKLVDATEEQIEADPYIESKLPCQVCESTDEGAMTITAYANLKNWTIA